MELKIPRPDAAALKLIAVVTMLIDHACACLLNVRRSADGRSLRYSVPMGETIYQIGRGIGRTALPIFCFLLVEGFFHTRNRARYIGRILLFAFVSQPVFEDAIYYDHSRHHLNTLFTLAIGLVVLWGMEMAKQLGEEMAAEASERRASLTRGAVLLISCMITATGAGLATVLRTDYRWGGVVAIALLYYFHGVRELALTMEWICLSVYSQTELMSFGGVLLTWLYSGERGRQNKYAFYLFYPLHLLILCLLRRALTGQ